METIENQFYIEKILEEGNISQFAIKEIRVSSSGMIDTEVTIKDIEHETEVIEEVLGKMEEYENIVIVINKGTLNRIDLNKYDFRDIVVISGNRIFLR
ncbi:MAG: hypothetical protein HFJ27_02435 [Clostridia bacterium]|nr:hypothetical protein [Clostridia bacterium]